MIQVQKLTKRFGEFIAVDAVSFEVKQGDVLAFLGPNGAGKSTTMKMLTGFLAPTSGKAVLAGHDIDLEPLAAKAKIGYLPEANASYKNLTPLEFLRFITRIRGLEPTLAEERIKTVMAQTHLYEVRHQTIDTLSKGFRQRVGFAQALVHDPPILILDEPTDGLDPNQKQEVRALIRSMASQKAVILSTHILEEMEAVASRAIILNQGRIVFDGTPQGLINQAKSHHEIRIRFEGALPPGLAGQIEQLSTVQQVRAEGNLLIVHPKEGKNLLAEVNHFLFDHKAHILEIQLEKGQLDQVFQALTHPQEAA